MKHPILITFKVLLILLGTFLKALVVDAQCGIGYKYDFKNITDLEKRELKGRVSNVVYSHFDVNNSFGEISKSKINCEQEIQFNPDGTVNKIIEKNEINRIYQMDIYDYENDEIKLISHYRNDGKLFAKTVFVKNNFEIREQRYLPNGELNEQYFIRKYDSAGKFLKEIWLDHKDKKYRQEFNYEYDRQGRVIKYKSQTKTKNVLYDKLTSKLPVKIEEINNKTGQILDVMTMAYDSNGSLIGEYRNGILVNSYEYTYDAFGNWLSKIEYDTEAKIPVRITERKIVYFN